MEVSELLLAYTPEATNNDRLSSPPYNSSHQLTSELRSHRVPQQRYTYQNTTLVPYSLVSSTHPPSSHPKVPLNTFFIFPSCILHHPSYADLLPKPLLSLSLLVLLLESHAGLHDVCVLFPEVVEIGGIHLGGQLGLLASSSVGHSDQKRVLLGGGLFRLHVGGTESFLCEIERVFLLLLGDAIKGGSQ